MLFRSRTNMLEENDAETEFSQLRELYDNLLTAHKAIEKAREQAALLQPILEVGATYHTATKDLSEAEELQEQIAYFFAHQKATLYNTARQELDSDILRKGNQIEDSRRIIAELGLQRDELTVSISGNKAYEQLQQLERNIKQAEDERVNRQNRANQYNKLVTSLDWKTDPSAKQFYQGLEDATSGIAQAATDVQALEDKEFELKTSFDQAQQLLNEQKAQVVSLQQRKNRVPIEQITIREGMMKKLNILERDLPFVAELIKVVDPAWEATAERLFRSLGLTLLVKEEHLEVVNQYLNRNQLQGKIVCLKLDKNPESKGAKIHKDSILDKIEIKKGSDFTTDLEAFLRKTHNFKCVDGVAELLRYPHALTEKG